MMWNKSFFFLCIGIIFFVLIYLLAPILTPFFIGILLAYLVNPLVTWLMRFRIPRVFAVVLVFVLLSLMLLLTILLLIPLIQKQLNTLIQMIPRMIEWFQLSFLPYVTERFGNEQLINVPLIKKTLSENWTTAGSYIGIFLNTIVHSGFLIVSWFMNLILIPVVTFYLLCDWERLVQGIKNLLPRANAPTIIRLSKECDQVLGAFFRGQLLVMLFIAVFYSIGLTIVGLNIGIILGIILGIISIVPYLGVVVGVTTASIAAYVQFGYFQPVLFVWLLFLIGQLVDSFFVTPHLVGDRIGLHPVIVIFAILAGGSLFGFLGVLLALPIAAVIMVWLRFLMERYHESSLYQ